jgi:hypothetical protein
MLIDFSDLLQVRALFALEYYLRLLIYQIYYSDQRLRSRSYLFEVMSRVEHSTAHHRSVTLHSRKNFEPRLLNSLRLTQNAEIRSAIRIWRSRTRSCKYSAETRAAHEA